MVNTVTQQVRRGMLMAALLAFSMCASAVTTWSCAQSAEKTVAWDAEAQRCRVFRDGKMWEYVDTSLCKEGRP